MKTTFALSGLAALAAAFPAMDNIEVQKRALEILKRDDPLGLSRAQTNCGPFPCPTFSLQDQHVSLTGQNAYRAPSPDEIRGPCPGLNAAANHGYLPRSGIASIEETVTGLGALYNLAPELAAALAAYAVAIDGNIVEGVWSIGGPLPSNYLLDDILGHGNGLSYSHNNYEGDSSIGRNDAYLGKGDAHSLNITKFEKVYALGGPENRYTLDKFRSRFEEVQQESIQNNPYYFTGAFSTIAVVPAAYNFVINLMSNHSADQPSGYLDGYNFKTFFGVSGEPGSFKWKRGQERVPENWYRRPSYNQYDAARLFADLGIGYAAYPKTLKFGGNTGKVNSFVGLDVSDLTGGAFNALDLLKGDNLGCCAFALAQQGLPAALKKPLNLLSPITGFLNKYLSPVLTDLSCPGGSQFDQGLFNQFPGYTYSPEPGAGTNYKQ